MSAQLSYFLDGGYVIHKAIDGRTSAWFDNCGKLALCLNRPEAEAAACVVRYIERMQGKYKDWPVVTNHIKHVKAGYLAQIGDVDHLTTQCVDPQAVIMNPMTWTTYAGTDLTGWLVSEKLDGVRALWDGVQLTTQTGHPIAAPAWFTAGLPTMRMEGELYAGPGTLPRVQGLARRHTPGDWSGLELHLFDAPAIAGGFAARLQALQWLAGTLPAHIRIVPHELCPGRDWLAARFADIVASGSEGLVARHPSGQYRAGQRDAQVVKIKQHPDTAFLLGYSVEQIAA